MEQEIKAGSNAVTTITVDDIVAYREELKKREVRLIDEIMEVPGEVKLQTFLDPDGNTWQAAEMLH